MKKESAKFISTVSANAAKQLIEFEVEEESNGSIEGDDNRQGEQNGRRVPATAAHCHVGSSDEGQRVIMRSSTLPRCQI